MVVVMLNLRSASERFSTRLVMSDSFGTMASRPLPARMSV
ncbi:Uncharacterised protein [Mycobacterium tuberculosis]|nr:Uncharacterised protein [Mycobacterium tuberculosis]